MDNNIKDNKKIISAKDNLNNEGKKIVKETIINRFFGSPMSFSILNFEDLNSSNGVVLIKYKKY